MKAELIAKYFPGISPAQQAQFEALDALYRDWNSKINVVSRKDIDNLYEHHVLHSLAIAKVITFKAGTRILDFGTGGGFPGIPLAILFPECSFRLIDGTGKKILVASEVAKGIGLTNVEAVHLRGEEETGKYHFVVSRAVMPLPDLEKIVRKNIQPSAKSGKGGQANSLPNGIITLKGGNLDEELKKYRKIMDVTPIDSFFEEEWFKEKNVVYIPM